MTRRVLPKLLEAGVGVVACVLVGCQHHTRRSEAEGRSSFTFVEPLAVGGKRPQLVLASEKEAVDVLVEARLVEPVAKPIYPAAALAAKVDGALVGVQIRVDVDGRVTEVGSSLVCFSTPGPFATEFRAAVEAAVAHWKFTPAKRRRLEPVRVDDGSFYWRNASEEKIEATLDLAFTFTADGEVGSSPVR